MKQEPKEMESQESSLLVIIRALNAHRHEIQYLHMSLWLFERILVILTYCVDFVQSTLPMKPSLNQQIKMVTN